MLQGPDIPLPDVNADVPAAEEGGPDGLLIAKLPPVPESLLPLLPPRVIEGRTGERKRSLLQARRSLASAHITAAEDNAVPEPEAERMPSDTSLNRPPATTSMLQQEGSTSNQPAFPPFTFTNRVNVDLKSAPATEIPPFVPAYEVQPPEFGVGGIAGGLGGSLGIPGRRLR